MFATGRVLVVTHDPDIADACCEVPADGSSVSVPRTIPVPRREDPPRAIEDARRARGPRGAEVDPCAVMALDLD